MEKKNHAEKTGSFTRINGYKKNDYSVTPESPNKTTNQQEYDDAVDDDNKNIDHICQDIDRFINAFSTAAGNTSNPPESLETLCKIIELRISKYNSDHKFGRRTEQDESFIKSVKCISKLTNALTEFPSTSTATNLDRTSSVLQRAMAFMEEEFRTLLEDYRNPRGVSKIFTTAKTSSFNSGGRTDSDISSGRETYPEFTTEFIAKLKMLAYTMVFTGYETECCQVYTIEGRTLLKDELKKLEFNKINMEDVQKMQWEPLEGEIARWIEVVKHCSTVLFPRERKFVESVFSDYPLLSRSLFANLARTIVIQLLDFVEAVAMTKRSAEKLFKFLDMFETLRDLVPAISSQSDCSDSEHELKSEIQAARDRIGEAAVNIFCDLENSINSDAAKTAVPGGAVHPLTRYVMNYLKYACEYRETLKQIFLQHSTGFDSARESPDIDETATPTSPFSKQLLAVMDLLDANLEVKSRLYKEVSLRYIFLMNNGRYILQKVKGSTEIHQGMGDTWYRKRSTVVRQYHKSYQRETWGRLLQCISVDGLQQVHGKASKQLLKEKFKNFSTMFDEIHKTQSTWIVSDEQLLSELRVSISAVVIPAYRSFLGRYRNNFGSGKQAEKYIKYQAEDIETLIEGLFEGNHMSMARKR